MSVSKFFGSAKIMTTKSGHIFFIGEVNLTQLGKLVRSGEVETNKWKDKNGNENESLKFKMFPLKEENTNEFRTHSLSYNDYQKSNNEDERQVADTPADDGLPF